MTTNLICLWEFSHYGCLREVSHNEHNQQRFTHVTKFMKYIVHGWDAQCRELSMRLRMSCISLSPLMSFNTLPVDVFPCWGFTT